MSDAPRSTLSLIRNEPVQARSTARLSALLDAAAAVIDEIGYERLTTAMVAERAGASIGTVYRYFPDRIAVLQSLAARNLDRIREQVRTDAAASDAADARAAVHRVFDRYVDAFRVEPGFASLRLGDVLDLRPWEGPRGDRQLAELVVDLLVERFDVTRDEALVFSACAAIDAVDAVLAHAFDQDAAGDDQCIGFARWLLDRVMDDVRAAAGQAA